VEPGLFLADNGETLDLRGEDPTWASLRLVRVAGGPAPWQWAILGLAAILAAMWLVAAAVRMIRRRHSPSGPTPDPAIARRWRPIAGAFAMVTAMLALLSVVMISAVPGLVDSGFLGWLELPMVFRLILHLPLGLAVVSACMVVLVAAGWVLRWWSSALRLQYTLLAVAAVAVVAQLAAWQLIGWGFT